MHLLHGPPVKFTIAAELLGENPISANQQLITATAVPNTIGCVVFLVKSLSEMP